MDWPRAGGVAESTLRPADEESPDTAPRPGADALREVAPWPGAEGFLKSAFRPVEERSRGAESSSGDEG